jgi:ABC-type glycerol-3-phosphate transport system substrate-binding protein
MAVTSALAVMLCTAGCTTATNTTANSQSGPAKLTFWMTGSEDDAAVVQSAADLYHASHSDVTVKVQAVSWDDAHAKLLAAATARSGPDIMSGGLSWAIEFGQLSGMVDLRKYGIDQIKQQTVPGVWSSVVSPDGALYGIPLDMTLFAFYYRPDLLTRAGIPGPPSTWAELTADITKLKSAGVKYPFVQGWGNFDWLGFFNYLKQAGGSFYDSGCTKSTLDTPAGLAALRYWAAIYQAGAPTGTVDIAAGMAGGQIAMAQDQSPGLKTMDVSQPGLAGKWSVAALPAGSTGDGSFIGGRVTGVMSYTKYAAQAAGFVKFLYADDAIAAMQKTAAGKGSLWISARIDLIDRLDIAATERDALKKVMASAEGPPNCHGWDAASPDVAKQLQSVVLGQVDPATALHNAAQILDKNLK